MTGKQRQADEIEITDAMLDAGARYLQDLLETSFESARRTADSVFMEMWSARGTSRGREAGGRGCQPGTLSNGTHRRICRFPLKRNDNRPLV
jgi:hypothetical protein